MIKGIEYLNYFERLRSLSLVTLHHRRYRADIIQVNRIINNIDLVFMNDLSSYDTGVTSGNVKKLFKPRSVSSKKQHCFSHRVIND